MFRGYRFAALRGFATLLAAALLFALLAAACGGGGGEGETPQAGETPTADGGEGADGEGLQELQALAGEAAEEVIAKVTYSVVIEADGETTEGEIVSVRRPPDSRFEIVGQGGGETSRTIIISAGGKSYLCTSAAGEESCLVTEAGEAGAAAFHPLFSIPQELTKAEDVEVVEMSERKIAGVGVTCFTVRGELADLGEGEFETCFSDEGLLLLLRSEGEVASFVFEATSVSTDVTDADFEPPYPVKEFEMPDFQIPTIEIPEP